MLASLRRQRQVRAGVAFASQGAADRSPWAVFPGVRRRPDDRRRAFGEDRARRHLERSTGWGRDVVGARAGVRWSTLATANPAISGGLTVRLPHSAFVEGHVTKEQVGRRFGVGTWRQIYILGHLLTINVILTSSSFIRCQSA